MPKKKRGTIVQKDKPKGKYVRIDLDQLKRRCLMPFEDYAQEGLLHTVSYTSKGKVTGEARHIFIDRGASVLAVAHLDTVQALQHFEKITIDGEVTIYNTQLDDRLGAYIILDFLPLLNINCDVLLTEGEESMSSTAQDFQPPKPYNWMFSFDRAGTDVVLYQYTGKDWEAAIKTAGMRIGQGSYSDIAELSHLGCMGLNVGCGYYDNHGKYSYMFVNDTVKMINQFAAFYRANKDTFFDAGDCGDFWSARNHLYGKWDDDYTPSNALVTVGGKPYTPSNYDFECDQCGKHVRPNSDEEDCVFDHGCCIDCYERLTGEKYDAARGW